MGCQALLLGKVVAASAEYDWTFASSESTGSTNGCRADRRLNNSAELANESQLAAGDMWSIVSTSRPGYGPGADRYVPFY